MELVNSSVLHVPTQERLDSDENDRKGVLFIGDCRTKGRTLMLSE